MPDREKVINGLHCCGHIDGANCGKCPYDITNANCTALMSMDALELLTEPEAIEPTVSSLEEHDEHGSWWYQCGKCKMPIDCGDRFCRHCGQEVQWK